MMINRIEESIEFRLQEFSHRIRIASLQTSIAFDMYGGVSSLDDTFTSDIELKKSLVTSARNDLETLRRNRKNVLSLRRIKRNGPCPSNFSVRI